MKKTLSILVMFYGWLLSFYPLAFREEFSKDMLLDFGDKLESASLNGVFSMTIVMLQELRDIPINAFRSHLEEVSMYKMFRSQTAHLGFRGAVGFSLAFAGASAINSFFMFGLTSRIPFLNRLGTIIFDNFRSGNKPPNFSILYLAVSALAALVFGIMFAIFFADRTQYPKYILAGLLGWLAPSAIASVFSNTIYADYYLDSMQFFYLYNSEEILTGAFLGLIFSVVKSERREPLRLLTIVTFIIPIITYLYVKALYYFDVVTTPWFLTTLIIMIFIYFMVVLMIAWSAERKIPWVVFVGAIAKPLVMYIPILVLPKVFVSLTPELSVINNITSLPTLGTVVFKMALQQAMLGLLLGLILGILLGFIKRYTSTQLTV